MSATFQTYYFDFREGRMYASEDHQCHVLVEAIRWGIRYGCNIPPVEVVQLHPRAFTIFDGHHRARAHYLEEVMLPYEVLWECDGLVGECLISDLQYSTILDRSHGLRKSLSFLPLRVAQEFCTEHGLGEEYLVAI